MLRLLIVVMAIIATGSSDVGVTEVGMLYKIIRWGPSWITEHLPMIHEEMITSVKVEHIKQMADQRHKSRSKISKPETSELPQNRTFERPKSESSKLPDIRTFEFPKSKFCESFTNRQFPNQKSPLSESESSQPPQNRTSPVSESERSQPPQNQTSQLSEFESSTPPQNQTSHLLESELSIPPEPSQPPQAPQPQSSEAPQSEFADEENDSNLYDNWPIVFHNLIGLPQLSPTFFEFRDICINNCEPFIEKHWYYVDVSPERNLCACLDKKLEVITTSNLI